LASSKFIPLEIVVVFATSSFFCPDINPGALRALRVTMDDRIAATITEAFNIAANGTCCKTQF